MESKNENVYTDQSTDVSLTKKDLNKMAWRSLLLQASFNYERMQAAGWLYSMAPALKKIHKKKEDLSKSMKMHLEFFNTHPFLVTFVMGIISAMEENKNDLQTIRGIKVATMGPLGGIGDALFWLTLLPISAGIGASLAVEGSIAGPIIFLLLFNIVHFSLRFGLMHYGYQTGVRSISKLKENTKKVSRAANIVGLSVIGGLVASYISLKTTLVINAGKASVALQGDVLDKIMPKLLPALYALLMYWLLKRGWSPIKLIALTVVFGVVGKYLTIL
ncbi:PTS system mannose/fructose/sorbose family transporter subunit IID [Halanaerobium salsuginis]|jgi:PTS system N-acetylgalactosamine-specific IID component|uniref:PTS system, N-acetylgalactosamine-specific IID component n=1 Tax=Halanaerobium salsuginis TaxID=29563 RepID=A0A1I4FJE6_9FIRM|nr:PTS system mannose/fructose/sorbose family transporter subunit IID [Halanaerobium salsuginis]SFL18042.1 PTS system, N-acetylgalactosamine-specific IID component [Halanaerobium salsuginis]